MGIVLPGPDLVISGSGGGLPTAVVEGQGPIAQGDDTYAAEIVRLPRTLQDAVVWLDFERLPDVSAGVSCGGWPSVQGGASTLFEGTAPTRSVAGAGGLDFSAAAGLMRVEGAVRYSTCPFTVAVMATPGATGAKRWWAHWGAHVGLLVNSAGQIRFEGGGDLASGVTPTDTVLAVATWDGTTKRIYVDGTEVASAAASISMTSLPFAIGSRGDGITEVFNGTIHAAGCWARALSAGEVTDLVAWVSGRIPS